MSPAALPPEATTAQLRAALGSRELKHVVVLGANGTMGYGSAALFTQAVEKVTFLARTSDKAQAGLDAAIKQVRSPTVASRAEVGSYDDDLDAAVGSADLVFEALTEDLQIKKDMFDRVEAARRDDAIVATVTSGLSINELAAGRSDSFRRNFLGLHFFNPPNVITGTELIPGDDTTQDVIDFVDAFSRFRLGREMVRTADTPAFAGNRVGFKVLNEAAQLAEQYGPAYVDRVVGPYTGRALTPLATIDLVGWDIHRAIVDNIHALTTDEAHDTLALPDYMARLIDQGVLGNKSGGGFFKRGADKARLVLDPATGDYTEAPVLDGAEFAYVDQVAGLYREGRYAEGMEAFLAATGDAADLARKVVAGYIAYAYERVGEVTPTINGIDRIMGAGFNWAPPGLLVDTMGRAAAAELITAAGLDVPAVLRSADGAQFVHPTMNPGKYFIAA